MAKMVRVGDRVLHFDNVESTSSCRRGGANVGLPKPAEESSPIAIVKTDFEVDLLLCTVGL
jgi:hypothetical protein